MNERHLKSLATEVVAALTQRSLVLATAESCTGGWLGKAITDVSGSSGVYDRGFITYSNQAKIDMLGVAEQTLQTSGAVSEKTTREMAFGAYQNSLADVAISTSGIAGPSGGSPEKPVGTICFGWYCNDQTTSITHHFSGDRESIRLQSTCYSLEKLIHLLD